MRPDRRPSGRFSPRYMAALLMLLAASLLAACGGGGEEKEAARDKTPEAAAATAAALANLESYRIAMRFTLEGAAAEEGGVLAVDLKGSFVTPDRSQTQVSARLGDLELEEEAIAIGEQAWVKVGDAWVEGEPQFDLGDLSPASLLEELGAEQLRLLKPTKETVNGVKSLRYSIDRADVEGLLGLGALLGDGGGTEELPEEFDIDLWLAEDGGWPVRITMTARGAIDGGEEINLDFSLNITDVNDPTIEIEPPEA